jgi:hypothetical protein
VTINVVDVVLRPSTVVNCEGHAMGQVGPVVDLNANVAISALVPGDRPDAP